LLVQVAANGDATVGTLLRAARMTPWQPDPAQPPQWLAEVRAGGDLLVDSQPAREEAESRHKAVSLWRALGLQAVGNTPEDFRAIVKRDVEKFRKIIIDSGIPRL
jgi:anthranilate/para-aminobenzoate synthase component I